MSSNVSRASSHADDLKLARELGANVETKMTNFKKAVGDGDQGAITAAKFELDQANQNLMALAATKDKEDEFIMQLIAMIRG